jgi:hypothetical protein
MCETVLSFLCSLFCAGLSSDDYHTREFFQDALRVVVWTTHWRGPLDRALASADPEVRRRGFAVLDEYENVLGPDERWPLVENLEAPARFRVLLEERRLEADLREMEFWWWGGNGFGDVIIRRDNDARRWDTELVVVEMVRQGLSRPEALAIIRKALSKENNGHP